MPDAGCRGRSRHRALVQGLRRTRAKAVVLVARRVRIADGGAPTRSGDLNPCWLLVQQRWEAEGRLSAQSAARFRELGDRFVTRLMGSGVSDWAQVTERHCAEFIGARTRTGSEPSAATQRLRRSTLRALFRELRRAGLPVGDPTIDIATPPRPARASRPLTDAEIELGRVASRLGRGSGTLLRAVAWALAEAGGSSSEIGAVTVADLDDPRRPSTVRFAESPRFAARTAPLTPWGAGLLARHLLGTTTSAPGFHLAYAGTGGTRYLAQASIAGGLTRVLDLAGLRTDPRVHARSVRAWAGRSRYDRGWSLEDVAQFLGHRSLDGAAREIGLREASR